MNITPQHWILMSQFKSAALLESAGVAVSVGTRPSADRSVFQVLGAATLIFAASAFGSVQAKEVGVYSKIGGEDSTGQHDQVRRQVVGEVVSVRHINQRGRGSHRGEISPRSIAGAIVGGVLGHQVGGGTGQKLTTLLGAVAGGSIANRMADRRQGAPAYENARQVEDNNLVVVSVPVGGTYETYEIVQPAGIQLDRGDAVALMTSHDGKTLMAFPVQMEVAPESRPAPRSRPRR